MGIYVEVEKEITNPIFDTIQTYLTSVLIDRDIEKAGAFLAEEIVCCDLNTTQFLLSKQRVLENLQEKMEQSVLDYSFSITDEVIREYGEMATFLGKIRVEQNTDIVKRNAIIQYSVTLKKEDTWKICVSHYSIEKTQQAAGCEIVTDVQVDTLLAQVKEIRLSEKKFRIALAQAKSIIFDYDLQTEYVHVYNLMNPAEDKVVALTQIRYSFWGKENIYGEDIKAFHQMFEEIKQGNMYAEGDIRTVLPTGEEKWYHFLLTTIYNDNGEPMYAIGTAEDITRRKKSETDLRYKAETDLLTDVYNKLSVAERIEKRLATPEGIQKGAFLIMDIDCFKTVNDTYGHPKGDEVLKKTVEVLKNNFRETDVIGRLGGDEFCVFVEGTKNIHLLKQKADLINEEIRAIAYPGGEKKKITVSIGITTCNGQRKKFEQVYKEADLALYKAKQKGRNTFCFYEE